MGNRKEITDTLSAAIEKKINPYNDPRIYWAKEVTFDYSTNHAVRVDYMKFVPVNNSVSGIEKGDFYSGHGLNFLGDYNYIVMPEDVYQEVSKEIPYYVGVYTSSGGELECTKKAKRHDRTRPVSEMLLMMFRSAARERMRR